MAILFATTLYSSNPIYLNLALLVPAIYLVLANPAFRKRSKGRTNKVGKEEIRQDGTTTALHGAEKDAGLLPQKPFITVYRGTMMVITCIAILAVDFRVFPRRFAKVENWGTSLMDMGVGSFVFSAGVVAARPILKQRADPALTTSIGSRLRASARHCFPLLVLGFIRLYSVKGLDYAEHVTEYGVHWNFFFTLAFISPFVAIFDSLFNIVSSYAALAILIAGAYEIALDNTGLKIFIFTAQRTDMISQNREGLCSLFGYLAIFLAGQDTGMYVLPRPRKESTSVQGWRNSTLARQAKWAVIWSALFWLSTSYGFGLNLQVSRRLANLPYVLWVAAFNTSQLTLFCLIETIFLPNLYDYKTRASEHEVVQKYTSPLLRAFNRNGLAIFLLANLLTGLVNLTLPTLNMTDMQAMAVLLAYITTLSGVALILDKYNISIKF